MVSVDEEDAANRQVCELLRRVRATAADAYDANATVMKRAQTLRSEKRNP